MKLEFFSMREVSERLGVGYKRLWYAVATGKVKPLTVGRARLFTEQDIELLSDHFAKGARRANAIRKT